MTVGLVTCQQCGSETPLETIDENDDTCPSCGTEIDPDAPVTIPTDLAVENWEKVIDRNPIGGVNYDADEVSEPERDVGSVTDALADASEGEAYRLEIGVAGDVVEAPLYLLSREHDVAGFEHRLNFVEEPRDDGWTRLYITGTGNEKLDPWEVVSAPYDLERNTADMRDFAANGWIVSAAGPAGGETP